MSIVGYPPDYAGIRLLSAADPRSRGCEWEMPGTFSSSKGRAAGSAGVIRQAEGMKFIKGQLGINTM